MNSTGTILLQSQELEIDDCITNSEAFIDENITASYSMLHKIQKKDKEYRVQYLLDMADQYAATNNIPRHTAIRELLVHEELRDTFQKIGKK